MVLNFYPPFVYKGISLGLVIVGLLNFLIQDLIMFVIWIFVTITSITYSFFTVKIVELKDEEVLYYFKLFRKVSLLRKCIKLGFHEINAIVIQEVYYHLSDIANPEYFMKIETSNVSYRIRLIGELKPITKELSMLEKKNLKITHEVVRK